MDAVQIGRPDQRTVAVNSRVRISTQEVTVAGVSGKGNLMQAGMSKTVHKAVKNSAGAKPADGTTSPIPSKVAPSKKQNSPNGFSPLAPTGKNAKSAIATGPGKHGKSKH